MVCNQTGIKMMATTRSSGDSREGGRGAEIVFFDLETTGYNRVGQRFWVLEFGAIVVCPRNLVELESYCTLIRPQDLTVVALKSGRSHGITRKAVATAPMFEDVADRIFGILNGRVWAGHNIQRFDCARIKEAFADIGRPAPVPAGMIDSLGVLSQKFGRRAGDMKMETLAAYFGLGQQKHRSLDDVRMNLEVLKHCATVLFLESSLPAVLNYNSHQGSPTVVTRSRGLESSLPAVLINNSQGSPTVVTRSKGLDSSPPAVLINNPQGSPTIVTRSRSKGLMAEGVKDLLCKTQNKSPLTNFLKHSHSLLR